MQSYLILTFFFVSQFLYASEIIFQKSQKYAFTYEVVIAPSQKENKKLSLWIPYPVEDQAQKVFSFKSHSVWPVKLTQENKYGNRMIYIEGKTKKEPVTLKFEYKIERFPYKGEKKNDSFLAPALYRGPDKLVPIFPEIQTIAKEETKKASSTHQKIRALYDYIINAMTYDKSGTGWGNGDAVWACSTKRGNCTDFHSLFIALNRSENIPARFEIGFPIPVDKTEGEIAGYHCWAAAYDKHKGWIPVDATEAKKTGEIEKYFGALPSNRIKFSQGRDIVLNPRQKGEPLNYFIYPYAEVAGEKYPEVSRKFYFKTLS
ncbi:MAG: transglutaminase domain-containing protein [Deltaproteobacteria bacterium]|nr:transglutaminase domain-containing protein [Deltaproteobacteria bacterium]